MANKILMVAEFDPAGVLLSHRDALRSIGVDCRVALQCAYTPRQHDADWVAEHTIGRNGLLPHTPSGFGNPSLEFGAVAHDVESLRAFAQACDTIVIAPGIGQPWADQVAPWPRGRDAPNARYFGIDWRGYVEARVPEDGAVAYIHGSINAETNADELAHVMRAGWGFRLAASTLDYAARMGATYLPPEVPDPGVLAPLRGDDDPLIVAHCPTNPANCDTDWFMDQARRLGIVVRYVHGRSHAESLAAKAQSHATFDHLRGAFSVNSVEAFACGSVPLFALTPEAAWAAGEDWLLSPVTRADVRDSLAAMVEDPAGTRALQVKARRWYERHFTRKPTVERLRAFYRISA